MPCGKVLRLTNSLQKRAEVLKGYSQCRSQANERKRTTGALLPAVLTEQKGKRS